MIAFNMDQLQRRIRQVEIADTIRSAISQWYFEQGIPEPRWEIQRDPQWWKDYLLDLGLDPNNK